MLPCNLNINDVMVILNLTYMFLALSSMGI